MRKRVYIAGPISLGDRLANVQAAMAVGARLLDLGYAPLIPHLSHFWDAQHPRPYSTWLDMDLAWVAVAQAVLRLPGISPGADVEVTLALALSVHVYHSVEDLLVGLPP